MPALLEHGQLRKWIKGSILLWCKCAAWLLGIHSYLLGDEPQPSPNSEEAQNNENNEDNENNPGIFNGIGGHQAILNKDGPIRYQPYIRPSWFYARLFGKS